MSQSNMPAPISRNMQQLVAAVPQEYALTVAQNFQGALDDFGGSFRNISFKGFQFTLKESGSSQVHPHPHLQCVILGMAPDNHCVWYEKAYGSQTDGEKPDAVWYEKMGAPANVPATALVKSTDGRNQYQIQRRLVVALLRQNVNDGSMYIDLDNPFVMDCGSMSIFGKDMPEQMAFSIAGLMRFCTRSRVVPCQFITQVVFDRSEPVPSVRFVPAHQNGQLIFLDAPTLNAIYNVAGSPTVADMLNVRLIPDPNQPQQAAQPAPAAAPVQAPQQTYAAPAAAPVAQPMAQPQAAPQAPQQAYTQPAPAPAPVAQAQYVAQTTPAPAAAPQAPAPVAAPMDNAALLAAAQQASIQANATLGQYAAPVAAAPQATPSTVAPVAAQPQYVAPAAPVATPAAAPAPAPAGANAQDALQSLLAQAGAYGAAQS